MYPDNTTGHSGVYHLEAGVTVLDDEVIDTLFGGDHKDWFLYSSLDDDLATTRS